MEDDNKNDIILEEDEMSMYDREIEVSKNNF
jgi:hypothetical protein